MPDPRALPGRAADFAAAVAALPAARAAGFDSLTLDLICGRPGQSVADWQRTLAAALPLNVEHISLYCLTIEPGTPMQRWLHNGTIMAPDPDTAADQYEAACHALAAAGYGHYEISNRARPGRECRHNVVYWRNEPYLGLGAGAHGMAAGYRYQVVRQPRTYIRRITNWEGEKGSRGAEVQGSLTAAPLRAAPLTTDLLNTDLLPTAQPGNERRGANDSEFVIRHSSFVTPFPLSPAAAAHHAVDEAEAMSDTAITQLRLLDEGLDLAGFEARFGRAFDEVYSAAVTQLTAWELLRRADGRLLLTEKGRFLSNQVFYRFV